MRSSFFIFRSLIALMLLASAAPALAQPSRPESLIEAQRRSRRLQYQNQETSAHSMPALEQKQIEAVIQLQLVDGKTLECKTPNIDLEKLSPRNYRLDLENFKGITYINIGQTMVGPIQMKRVNGKVVNQAGKIVRYLMLTNMELADDTTLKQIQLQARPGLFHLSRNVQNDTGNYMVRLLQQGAEFTGGEGPIVQLWVTRSSYDGTGEPLNVSITEPDFQTLVRNHPKEADTYLRPLLREIGQDQILAPDWHVAWQVLADHWPAEDAVRQKVLAILPQLEDPDFRHREHSVTALSKLDRAGIAVLRTLDRKNLTPEQNRVIDLVLSPFAQLSAKDAEKMRSDKAFLLDCLYSEDQEVRAAAFDQLKKAAEKPDLKYDPSASAGDRASAIRAMRKTLLNGES